ncbi:MAG: FAD binding domain-containing protein [Chloroflexota bacterium]
MKPAPFEYVAPANLDQALTVLGERGDDAKVLAGGQSLVPMLNLRLARPALLVDLNQLTDLAYIRADDDGLTIGALTRQRAIERSALVGASHPMLAAATSYIGHPAIRNRGTVGGSLAHADPVSELPCVMLATDARMMIRGRSRERVVAAERFFQSVFTTALEPTEILVEVRVPNLPARTGWGFEELARRHGDFAIIGVASLLSLGTDGTIASARLAYAGAGDRPVRAREAERALVGQKPSPATFDAAARLAAREIDPPTDVHATADYRRTIATVLTRRALTAAQTRAAAGREEV